MKKNILRTIQYLLFLTAGAFLLWYVIKDQDINKIFEEFKHANYFWIALTFLFAIIANISRAVRWNILLSSLNYKTRINTTFHAVMLGYLVNFAVPRLGEITRCSVLNKKNKIPINVLVGTMIAERAFDVICLVIIIFITIFSQLDLLGSFTEKYILIPFEKKIIDNFYTSLIISVTCILLIIIAIILLRKNKEKIKQKSFYTKVRLLLIGFIAGIKSIKNIKKKSWFLIHTLNIWLMYVLMIYVGFFAIKGTSMLDFFDGITIMSVGSIGIIAPVPGGIGTYELTVITALTELFGIVNESAASFAYMMHISQFVFYVLGGAISLFILFFIKEKITNGKT